MTPSKILFVSTLLATYGQQLVLGDVSSYNDLENGKEDPSPLLFVEAATVGNKTFYAELLALANWTQAHHFCISQGMFLATVETQEERDALREFFTGAGVPEWSNVGDSNKHEAEFWASGIDLGTPGKYYWMLTGSPINDSTVVSGKMTCERPYCIPGTCRCADNSSCRDTSYTCLCTGQCTCGKACSGHCVATVHYSSTTTQLRSLLCGRKVKLLCQKFNSNVA